MYRLGGGGGGERRLKHRIKGSDIGPESMCENISFSVEDLRHTHHGVGEDASCHNYLGGALSGTNISR